MRAFICLVSLTVLWAKISAAETAYLCLPGATTGFFYNETTSYWEARQFNAGDRKYVLKKEDSGWNLSIFGSDDRLPVDCDETIPEGNSFKCDSHELHFRFNRRNFRYVLSHQIGFAESQEWFEQHPEGSYAPYLQLGNCSPL